MEDDISEKFKQVANSLPMILANQVTMLAKLSAVEEIIINGVTLHDPTMTKEKAQEMFNARIIFLSHEIVRGVADEHPGMASQLKKNVERMLEIKTPKDGPDGEDADATQKK